MLRSLFQSAPELKSEREIGLMREAGKLVARALRLCRAMARPGVRTIDIDRAVDALFANHRDYFAWKQRGVWTQPPPPGDPRPTDYERIKLSEHQVERHGESLVLKEAPSIPVGVVPNPAVPLFKGYPGSKVPFPASTCISINHEVVHGIPGPRVIREGDLVKIDTACKLNGWCADAATTVIVGEVRPEWRRLVRVAEEVLEIARVEMSRRRWWSEVALQMQRHAEGAGFTVVQQYVGHGIGRIMHENPQVPNFVSRELKKHDFRLEPGLVLAVEPMVNMGRPEVDTLRDHWTVVTRDGMPSVHVEHTLAMTKNGVLVVTADEEPPPPAVPLPPPFSGGS